MDKDAAAAASLRNQCGDSQHSPHLVSDEKRAAALPSDLTLNLEGDPAQQQGDATHQEHTDNRLTPGVMPAGPGENKKIIIFDVRAFFGDQRHIRHIGKNNDMNFKISGDAQIMKDILKAHGFTEMPSKSRFCNFTWIGNSVNELHIDRLRSYQSINHFVGSTNLTRKDKLYKNLSKLRKKKGRVDFVPITFVLPKEKRKFKAYYKKNPGPFIVKPVGLSRGRGVYLIDNPKDIFNGDEEKIVSRYIRNPLLIDGYKLDLRIYVLVTSFDPVVIYIYQEGLTRFATVKYKKDGASLHALRMHLTNYSINVSSGNYIRNEDSSIEDFGSKWTLSALLRYFQANGINTIVVMRRIEDLIIKTILAVEKPIARKCRIFQRRPSNCFELFGFDIMLDENYKPWLLEVNLSPSLVCTTPLDIKVKSNMLCDLLNLVGIECYEKTKPKESSGCFSCINSYVHKTVGYFCLCQIRARVRALLQWHQRAKRYRSIMDTYKTRPGLSKEELQDAQERRKQFWAKLKRKEQAMNTRIKNQERRGGGWVKIFPTVDSWHKYKGLMQYRTVKNVILHQHLYPSQHTTESSKLSGPSQEPVILSKSEEALLKNTAWDRKSRLSKGTMGMLQRMKRYQSSLKIGPPPMFTVRSGNKDCEKMEQEAAVEDMIKKKVMGQVNKGHLLTEVQARIAFLRYLTNIKQYLRDLRMSSNILTCPPVHVVEDLLYAFLGQSSDLVLDPGQRHAYYTLDHCLTNFLYHYHKETRQLMLRGSPSVRATGDSKDQAKEARSYVVPELFEEFIHSADPWEMEDLLLTYIKIHGNAKIFLRSRIQNRLPDYHTTSSSSNIRSPTRSP